MKKIILIIMVLVFMLSACTLNGSSSDTDKLIADMQSQISDLNDTVAQLQTDLNEKNEAIVSMNDKITNLQNMLTNYNTLLSNLSQSNGTLNADVITLWDEVEQTSIIVDDLKTKVDSMTGDWTEYASNIDQILSSLDSIQDQINLIVYNPENSSLQNEVIGTLNNVKGGIIGVSNFQTVDGVLKEIGVGSGVIYSRDGFTYRAVTNYHVVDGAEQVQVYLGNYTYVDATVLGTEEDIDLAVVEFTYSDNALPILSFANSEDVQNGQFVIAIGNPLGYEHFDSATFGIVSESMRFLYNATLDGYLNTPYVQTDTALNPGNSGGALLNLQGEIVGINVMKESYTTSEAGDYIPVDNLGYAIVSSMVQRVVSEIEQGLPFQRPLLGIVVNGDNNQVNVLNVSEGSVADIAGVQVGDIITDFNGHPVSDINMFRYYIALQYKDDVVTMTVLRDGEPLTLTLTLTNIS